MESVPGSVATGLTLELSGRGMKHSRLSKKIMMKAIQSALRLWGKSVLLTPGLDW